MKPIFEQLIIIFKTVVFKKSLYPSMQMWGYWKSYINNEGKTVYDQIGTLKAYLAK